ncbi:MAG: polyprenyl synthetase family protein [Oligoflexales bacterium]
MQIPFSSDSIPLSVLSSVQKVKYELDHWDGNARIGDVLSRTVLKGGKRLRPILTFVMGDLFGLDHQTTAPYSRAVELVHASTLAHDDVIDDAAERRGEPSINAVSSNKRAVLAGDYLLAYVLRDMSHRGRNDIVVELSNVIGDLAEGEWLQLDYMGRDDLSQKDIELVALRKTGSVLRWCCVVPALLANSLPQVVKASERLGEQLGIAFQLTDDVLDFRREDGSALADLKNGVISSVVMALQEQDPEFCRNLRSGKPFDISPPSLELAITKVKTRAAELLEQAKENLQIIVENLGDLSPSQQSAIAALHFLSGYILTRV